MTHKGSITLRTQRLTLRRFTPEDAPAMFEAWANDERVSRYLTWTPHGSPEVTRQLLELWCADYEKDDHYKWAMEFEGKLIGDICVVHMNEAVDCATLGYCMGYDYWNKGLMTEAAQAVIDYLFGEIGVHRIEIDHAVKNPGSGKVAQKCGLTFEGTSRDSFKTCAGEYLDISHYAILRSEWEASHNV